MPWVQVDQRLALLVRLAHTHGAGQVHRQYREPFGNQLIENLLRQARPCLELVDHDAFHFQAFVMVVLQLFDLSQQAIQGLAGKAVAIERDQYAIGGNQR